MADRIVQYKFGADYSRWRRQYALHEADTVYCDRPCAAGRIHVHTSSDTFLSTESYALRKIFVAFNTLRTEHQWIGYE